MHFPPLALPEPEFEENIGILFVASTLYGAFFVLSVPLNLILHRQLRLRKGSPSTSSGTVVYLTLGHLLFFTVSLTWVLLWIMLTHPELLTDDQRGGYSVLSYTQNVFGVFATIVADWILIYRLYILWNRKKIILICTATLSIVQASAAMYQFFYFAIHKIVWVAGDVILFSLSVTTNIVATALISWRIWSTVKFSRALGKQGIFRRIIAILVESAALITVWMIMYMVLFLVKRKTAHIFLYGLPSVAGIATTLVNVRIVLEKAAGEEEDQSAQTFHEIIFAHSDRCDDDSSIEERG